jgi:glycosyltransferase involved in cell wall biosynthesis
MRILMFSINPLFAGTVMGGAPKHLQNIAVHLGTLGHEVTVLCTRARGSDTPFRWRENVTVKPTLPFKQPFPQPYAVPAYALADVVQQVGDELARADRFYMHDGELLFPYLTNRVPTVVSLRDNVYPETIHGGFLFNADRLILISEYSRRFFAATVGRFFPEFDARAHVIHNGLDWERFKPTPAGEILNYLPFDPAQHDVILHPHRPEESKGVMQTLAVVDLLVHQHGLTRIKTLIPKWLDLQLTPELREWYGRIEQEIETRGLREHIVLHDWIPQGLMPEYFSLGAVTLSLGHFAESFGNAVYESLGCGTPSIAARVTTHRELLPEGLLARVDFDDAETAAALAAEIIASKAHTSPETLAYLHQHYSIERQLNAYADAILNAQIAPPMTYRHPELTDDTPYRLAPWCFVNVHGLIYHDLHANYVSLGELGDLLARTPEGISPREAARHGIAREVLTEWYSRGYLVPAG